MRESQIQTVEKFANVLVQSTFEAHQDQCNEEIVNVPVQMAMKVQQVQKVQNS